MMKVTHNIQMLWKFIYIIGKGTDWSPTRNSLLTHVENFQFDLKHNIFFPACTRNCVLNNVFTHWNKIKSHFIKSFLISKLSRYFGKSAASNEPMLGIQNEIPKFALKYTTQL